MKMKQKLLITSLLAIALGLFGNCEGGSSDSSGLALAALGGGGGTTVASNLSDVSAASYDDNSHGLISASTLRTWIADWANNKPAGITGNLVIFQADKVGTGSTKNAIATATGVYVYISVAPYINFRGDRDNGLITVKGQGLLTGAAIDTWFQTYNVDPTKDLIVFAGGAAEPYGNIGRAYYILRYWGVSLNHLAILNGTVKGQFPESELADDGLAPPLGGTFSVKQLKNVDNRILALSVEDTIKAVRDNGHHGIAGLSSKIYISDNRTKSNNDASTLTYTNTAGWQEYNGGENATGSTNSGVVAFEGHLKGAVFVPHYNFVDRSSNSDYAYGASAAGTFSTYKFKSKAVIKNLWDTYSIGKDPDNPTQDNPNSPNVGAPAYEEGQTVLQYCRTNTRTMTSGITTLVILGRPTVFLEDGWSIFGWLAGNLPAANFTDDNATGNFPSIPAEFAPDLQGVIESGTRGSGLGAHYNGSGANTKVLKSKIDYFTVNPSATTTKKAQNEDWAYKNQ